MTSDTDRTASERHSRAGQRGQHEEAPCMTRPPHPGCSRNIHPLDFTTSLEQETGEGLGDNVNAPPRAGFKRSWPGAGVTASPAVPWGRCPGAGRARRAYL